MDQASEDAATNDSRPAHVGVLIGRTGLGGGKIEPAVGPGAVVMADVRSQDSFEVSSPEDQDPVEAFGAHRSDPTFRERIRLGLSG